MPLARFQFWLWTLLFIIAGPLAVLGGRWLAFLGEMDAALGHPPAPARPIDIAAIVAGYALIAAGVASFIFGLVRLFRR